MLLILLIILYATFNLKKDSRGRDTFEYLKKTTKQINFITAILKRDVVYLNTLLKRVLTLSSSIPNFIPM